MEKWIIKSGKDPELSLSGARMQGLCHGGRVLFPLNHTVSARTLAIRKPYLISAHSRLIM